MQARGLANNAVTNFGGAACPCPTEPAKTELYGGFVQGSYTFDPAVLFLSNGLPWAAGLLLWRPYGVRREPDRAPRHAHQPN